MIKLRGGHYVLYERCVITCEKIELCVFGHQVTEHNPPVTRY